jgi:glycosyltransferase involved in cell wall biosynthesis
MIEARLKILMVLDSYPPDLNGGAYFTHRLARQLVGMGVDVLVVCPSRSMKTHYDEYQGVRLFRVRSFPAVLYPNFRICWPVGIRRVVCEAIRRFAPDVVHLQGRFFLGDICMRHAHDNGIPMVATNHFMPENFAHHLHVPRALSARYSRLAWRWVREMFEYAGVWVTQTEAAATLMRANGFERPIHVVSSGIDRARFFPRPKSSTERLPVPRSDLPTVLYAGRFEQEKNIPVILRAMASVLKTFPCRLVLVGDGSERRRLRKLSEQLGIAESVHFAGYLSDEDYPLAFALADCFVHAGTAELQSIVTLEAAASGLPIVAANAVALPELVRHGLNGFLFQPGKAEEAARFIREILQSPVVQERMCKESERISSNHDVAPSARQYVKLYEKAIVDATRQRSCSA